MAAKLFRSIEGVLLAGLLLASTACDRPSDPGTETAPPQQPQRLLTEVQTVELEPTVIDPERPVSVTLDLQFPDEHILNQDFPSTYTLSMSEGDARTEAVEHLVLESTLSAPTVTAEIETLPTLTEGSIILEARIFYCKKSGRSTCFIETRKFVQPYRFLVQGEGEKVRVADNSIRFAAAIEPPVV